jgi:hypothetical protein
LQDLDRALYFGIAAVLSARHRSRAISRPTIQADQRAGRVGGARLLQAGRGIGSPNAGPGAAAYKGIAYELTTPDEGRTAVRELAARKVDVIKIWWTTATAVPPACPSPPTAPSSTRRTSTS